MVINMDKNILLIVNPNAGKGKIQKKIPKIQKDLIKTGFNVDIINTQRKTPIKKIIKTKEENDIIICCGGDGTINDMVSSVMEMEIKPKVSFIPLGTVNDFARTIGLSRQKFLRQGILKDYMEKKVDIGVFNKKYFNYVAAFGAFTQVSYVTSQRLKKMFRKICLFYCSSEIFF